MTYSTNHSLQVRLWNLHSGQSAGGPGGALPSPGAGLTLVRVPPSGASRTRGSSGRNQPGGSLDGLAALQSQERTDKLTAHLGTCAPEPRFSCLLGGAVRQPQAWPAPRGCAGQRGPAEWCLLSGRERRCGRQVASATENPGGGCGVRRDQPPLASAPRGFASPGQRARWQPSADRGRTRFPEGPGVRRPAPVA